MSYTRPTKCVILAAGYGTRMLPITKAIPKEMLPVVDRPIIHFLVEEAVAAGVKDILIVSRSGKHAIDDYFNPSYEIETKLTEKKRLHFLGGLDHLAEMVNIQYVFQRVQRGTGDAILYARSFVGDEPFFVLYGDDIVSGSVPVTVQLADVYARTGAPVIALERVLDDKVSSCGIAEYSEQDGNVYKITHLPERPRPEDTPSRLGIVGKLLLTPDIFWYLESITMYNTPEFYINLAYEKMLRDRTMYGLEFTGTRYDTGNPFGYVQAIIDTALRGPDGEQVAEWIRERMTRE